jgi:hypothetical protein
MGMNQFSPIKATYLPRSVAGFVNRVLAQELRPAFKLVADLET